MIHQLVIVRGSLYFRLSEDIAYAADFCILMDYYISCEAEAMSIVTTVCVCVCLSVPRRIPTLLHGPGCNLEEF